MTSTLLASVLALSTLAPQLSDSAETHRSLARGKEALAAGKFDEARSAFEEVVRGKPEDARGWTLLARARCGGAEELAAKGEDQLPAAEALVAEAEEAARKAVELDERSAETWAALGHVLTRAGGRSDEAIATLYHAEKLAPPTSELLTDLADSLLAARLIAHENGDMAGAASRLEEAKAALERASRLGDAQVEVLRRKADILANGEEPALALPELRRAIHLAPADATLLESYLQIVNETQSFEEAIDFFTGLVDQPALSRWYRSRVHELRANLELKRNLEYAKAASGYLAAEQDFRACARLDPALKPAVDAYLPKLRAWRGHSLTLAERFAEAEAALFSAIDLESKDAEVRTEVLRYLHELQDAMWRKFGGESMPKEKWDEIRGFASKLCTVEAENAENWNNWGFFAREAAKYEESYLAYRRALALAPTNARYLNDTALILMYHLDRDLERAQDWLEQSIRCATADLQDKSRGASHRKDDETTLADGYGNLVNLLQGTARKDEAIACLREFEKALPGNSGIDYWKQKLLPEEWKAEQEKKLAEAEAKAKEEAAKAEQKDAPEDEEPDPAEDEEVDGDA